MITREPALSRCRALDAIRLATVLYFAADTGEAIEIVTFDQRMEETARSLRLCVRA